MKKSIFIFVLAVGLWVHSGFVLAFFQSGIKVAAQQADQAYDMGQEILEGIENYYKANSKTLPASDQYSIPVDNNYLIKIATNEDTGSVRIEFSDSGVSPLLASAVIRLVPSEHEVSGDLDFNNVVCYTTINVNNTFLDSSEAEGEKVIALVGSRFNPCYYETPTNIDYVEPPLL